MTWCTMSLLGTEPLSIIWLVEICFKMCGYNLLYVQNQGQVLHMLQESTIVSWSIQQAHTACMVYICKMYMCTRPPVHVLKYDTWYLISCVWGTGSYWTRLAERAMSSRHISAPPTCLSLIMTRAHICMVYFWACSVYIRYTTVRYIRM